MAGLLSSSNSAGASKKGGLLSQLSDKKEEKPTSRAAQQQQYANAMKSSRLAEVQSNKDKQDKSQLAQKVLATGGIGYEGLANSAPRIAYKVGAINAKAEEEKRIADAKSNADLKEKQRQSVAGAPKVLRPLIKGLNKLGDVTKPAADVALELYTPGAPFSVIGGATKGVESALAKYLPKLVNSEKVLPKVATTAIKEGAIGVPLGVGNQLARNPESTNKELLESALYGGAGGAILGGGGKLISQGIKNSVQSALGSQLDNVLAARNAINEASAAEGLPQAVRRKVSANAVPEVFPERYRRTVGPDKTVPVEPIVQAPRQAQTVVREAVSTAPVRSAEPVKTPNKYTPDQQRRLKEVDDQVSTYKDFYNRQLATNPYARETLDKQLKGKMFEAAAMRRGIIQGDSLIPVEGGFTGKELENKLKYLRSNYVGKEVSVDGVQGKIKGQSFGKVGVEFPDGTVKYFDSGKIAPVKDIDALIAEQTARKQSVIPTKSSKSPAPVPTRQPITASVRAARETVEQQRVLGERANYGTQVREGNFGDEFNQGIAARDRTYPVSTNAEQIAEANKRVQDLPKAEADFLGNSAPDANHVATGYRLLQELNRTKQTQRALNVADKLAADLTQMGQSVQAASIIKRLSPEGQLLHLQRTAKNAGKTVSEADAQVYTDLAQEVQQGTTRGVDTVDFLETLNRIKAGEQVSPEELSHASSILDDAKKYIKSGKQPTERLPREMKDVRTRDKVVDYLNSVEEAALARIQARKGNLNSLPLGEWADHALVASAQIAKGTIKAGTYVEDLVRLFGEEVRPYAKAIYEQGKKLLSSSSKNISEGKLNEANEVIERLRNSQTTAGKVAEKFIQTRDIKPGDVEKLRGLAKQLNDLRGKSAQEADMQMQAILNKYEKASWWDRVQAVRYIAMLFNSGTQSVNALSGPIMATTGFAGDLAGAIFDMAYSAIKKTPRTTKAFGSNPLRFMADWFKNVGTGAKSGWKGVNPSGIAGANDIRGLTYKSMFNPLGILERSLGAVAKGADYATYRTVMDSELRRQASLAANAQKLKGIERKQFIEKFLVNPSDEAQEIADKVARRTTFQRSDTLGGKAANFLNSAPPGVKQVANTVFPFVRTPVNIASAAVDLSPVGIIKGLTELARSGDDLVKRRDAIRTLGLSLVGGGLSGIGYYLNQVGILTGANDSGDKNVNAVREQAGQGKFRFNTSAMGRYMDAMFSGKGVNGAEKAAKYQKGDRQFDYNKLQPVAFPFALGASLNENKGDALKSAEDAGASLFGMSTLKGVQDVFNAMPGGTAGERTTGIINRLAESFLKSFSPSLLAQEAKRQDPIQRKTAYNEGIKKDVMDYFKSRTPGLSKSLQPRITSLGDTMKNAPGATGQYVNPYRSDEAAYNPAAAIISDLIERTGDKTLAPKPFSKSVEGRDANGQPVTKEIPQDMYNKLQQKVGEMKTQMIQKLPDKLTDEQRVYLIKKIYEFVDSGARTFAKQQLGIVVD